MAAFPLVIPWSAPFESPVLLDVSHSCGFVFPHGVTPPNSCGVTPAVPQRRCEVPAKTLTAAGIKALRPRSRAPGDTRRRRGRPLPRRSAVRPQVVRDALPAAGRQADQAGARSLRLLRRGRRRARHRSAAHAGGSPQTSSRRQAASARWGRTSSQTSRPRRCGGASSIRRARPTPSPQPRDFIEGHAKPKTRGWRGTARLLGLDARRRGDQGRPRRPLGRPARRRRSTATTSTR